MYIVKTPSQVFNGKRAGVHFSKGQATVEDAAKAEVLRSFGYEVIEVKEEAAAEPKAEKPKRKNGKKAATKGGE